MSNRNGKARWKKEKQIRKYVAKKSDRLKGKKEIRNEKNNL